MTWRQIETAPRDGTHILCKDYRDGYMNGNQQTPPYVAHWFELYAQWVLSSGDEDMPLSPTHWMPLPQPPQP